MALVLKTGKGSDPLRGFESHTLRASTAHRQGGSASQTTPSGGGSRFAVSRSSSAASNLARPLPVRGNRCAETKTMACGTSGATRAKSRTFFVKQRARVPRRRERSCSASPPKGVECPHHLPDVRTTVEGRPPAGVGHRRGGRSRVLAEVPLQPGQDALLESDRSGQAVVVRSMSAG